MVNVSERKNKENSERENSNSKNTYMLTVCRDRGSPEGAKAWVSVYCWHRQGSGMPRTPRCWIHGRLAKPIRTCIRFWKVQPSSVQEQVFTDDWSVCTKTNNCTSPSFWMFTAWDYPAFRHSLLILPNPSPVLYIVNTPRFSVEVVAGAIPSERTLSLTPALPCLSFLHKSLLSLVRDLGPRLCGVW